MACDHDWVEVVNEEDTWENECRLTTRFLLVLRHRKLVGPVYMPRRLVKNRRNDFDEILEYRRSCIINMAGDAIQRRGVCGGNLSKEQGVDGVGRVEFCGLVRLKLVDVVPVSVLEAVARSKVEISGNLVDLDSASQLAPFTSKVLHPRQKLLFGLTLFGLLGEGKIESVEDEGVLDILASVAAFGFVLPILVTVGPDFLGGRLTSSFGLRYDRWKR